MSPLLHGDIYWNVERMKFGRNVKNFEEAVLKNRLFLKKLWLRRLPRQNGGTFRFKKPEGAFRMA